MLFVLDPFDVFKIVICPKYNPSEPFTLNVHFDCPVPWNPVSKWFLYRLSSCGLHSVVSDLLTYTSVSDLYKAGSCNCMVEIYFQSTPNLHFG